MDVEKWAAQFVYVGPNDVSDEWGIDVRLIRAWCEENGTPTVGRQYILDPETAADCVEDLLGEDSDEDESEDDESDDCEPSVGVAVACEPDDEDEQDEDDQNDEDE